MNGKKITLFLHGGLPKGVREAKIDMWTGRSFCMPRHRIKDFLKLHPEAASPCVYFLIGTDEDPANIPKVYIGESINFGVRFDDHNYKKDWWDTVIIYFNSDPFGKDSIMYLEQKLYSELENTDRCVIDNPKIPTYDKVRHEDIPGLSTFVDNIKVITPLFGYDLFESVSSDSNQQTEPEDVFTHKEAQGRMTADGKFMVFANTPFRLENADHLSESFKRQREDFLSSDLFTKDTESYILNRDYVFNSSSQALKMITGTSISGPQSWKKIDGTTLKEFVEERD